MKRLLFLAALCTAASPAMAGALFDSIEDRAEAVKQQVKGKNDYHAHLAREYAKVADEEKSQHDTGVARYFMTLAEQEAAKSGGAK